MKMNIKGLSRHILRIAGLLIVSSLLGIGLLMLSLSLPGHWRLVKTQMRSLETFNCEGLYPIVFRPYTATRGDTFTDGIMMGSVLYDGGESPLEKAVKIYRYSYTEVESNNVAEILTGYNQNQAATLSYGRYWHGYLSFLRPLCMLFSYDDLRMLGCVIQGGLIIWIALELHRRRKTAVVPFFICVISVTPMVTVSSLQYMHVYILGLLAMLTVLKAGKWIDRKKLWPEFFAFIGILTSYIDLLTFPLVAFALPLMACFISDNEKLSLRFFFIMAISWAAGYGVFWAMKWVISWLTGYGEELGSALDSVARRSSRPEQGAANRLQAIVLNLRVFQRPGYIAAFLVGAGVILAQCVKSGRRFSAQRMLPLLMLSAVPFVWYIVLADHSNDHSFYTFRELAVTFFALAAIPSLAFREDQEKQISQGTR